MKRPEVLFGHLASLGLKTLQSDSLSERDPGIDPDNFGAAVAACPRSVSDVCAVVKFGDPGKLAMMQAIKQVLDPQNIMNPGKVLTGI